jgi:hypothetical protein
VAPPSGQAAAPTFSPAAGSYVYGTPVTLSTVTSGCNSFIYFGTSNPPVNHGSSFSVISNVTVYAQVVGCPGFSDSTVSSAAYTVTSGGNSWTNILSPARATDWTQAGVSGGIPSFSQCGSTIAPYGSSGSFASPATIISALNSCSGSNGYVLLGNGDFYLNAGISMSGVHNVELRGGGPQNTRLHFSSGSTCATGHGSCLIGFQSSDGTYASPTTPFVKWTSGYSQGATSITIASGASLAVGTMLVLDQCDSGMSGEPCSGTQSDNGNYFNCQLKFTSPSGPGCSENGPDNSSRPNRGQQEMVQVTACSPACGTSSSTVVTISHPLIHPNWVAGQTPEVWLIQPASMIGMQGFSINSTFSYSALTFGLGFGNVANFWVKNVQLSNFADISIFVAQSMNGDIESNYIYGIGQGNTGNDASGYASLDFQTIFQNNILQYGKPAVIPFGSGSGNVIAYNVAINAYTNDGYMFGDIWMGHSNGQDFNLYEGNYANQLLWDQTHGTQLMETVYRNFLPGFESCANGNCGSNTVKQNNMSPIQDLSFSRYANMVGNVLGTPGVSTLGYAYTNNSYVFFNGSGLGYIYNIASGNQSIPNTIPLDSFLIPTTLRWGNWDAFNSATEWNTGEVPSGISVYPNLVPTACVNSGSCPASFYLAARPSWWSGTIPFPAIGPDVTSGNVGQCTGTIGTAGHYSGVAATSSGQCTGTSLTTAWGGHVNAIPALACFLSLGGKPDGTGSLLSGFGSCY